MRIIDRYVLWSFIKNYLISFMVLIGMYIVLDMVFNFDDLAGLKSTTPGGGVVTVLDTLKSIADYYFYQAFLFFVHLSGIIPVVAAAFTLMRLSRFNELTALLAAGVPLLRIAMPIILAGLVLNGLVIADQELLIPQMQSKLARSHDDVHRDYVKSFPIEAMQDDARGLLYVSKYTPPAGDQPAVMETVDIVERAPAEPAEPPDPGSAVASADPRAAAAAIGDVPPAAGREARRVIQATGHVYAERATWNPVTQGWDLTNGFRVTGLAPDAPATHRERVPFYKSNINPEEIGLYRSGEMVELLSTSRIEELIKRPKSYGQANLLRVKHWRFTQPIMNVILLLLAIPCVLTREPGHLKTAATKTLVLTGLAMGSVFVCHQIAGNPPADPSWAQTWPALIAWTPIFVFGPLAVFLLDRVKS